MAIPADGSTVDKHVTKKYEIVKNLGKSVFSLVWQAVDKKTKTRVALKQSILAFGSRTDAQRTYREIIFLKELRKHPNIVHLLEVMKADNDKDLYLVFGYMECDLHRVIHAGILQDVHKPYILYQLLKALKYIHSANVLHLDIKPANLLIDSDCGVKLADFRMARSVARLDEESRYNPVLSCCDFVAARWYGAPELLLSDPDSARPGHTKGADMWSVGCVLGELLSGRPMFPGNCTQDQLVRIIEVTGRPSAEDVEAINSPFASSMLEPVPPSTPRSLASIFPDAAPEALDCLKQLLQFNPNKRPTAEKLLEHPFVAQFRVPEEEVVCDHDIVIPIPDEVKSSIQEYRNRIYQDMVEHGLDCEDGDEGTRGLDGHH